jgi:hypothetical protein
MNDQINLETGQQAMIDIAVQRKAIRDALIGNTPAPESRIVTVFGIDLEIRQPTFKDSIEPSSATDDSMRAAEMIIKYSYIPGTEEHAFEDTDAEMILRWPIGKDLMALNNTIAELTGVDIETAMEELKDPLSEQ